MLEPYLFTEANLTTYKLVQNHLDVGGRLPQGFKEYHLAAAMDSMLTLYHSVKLHSHGRHNCRWTGANRIHKVLSKVGILSHLTYFSIDRLGLGNMEVIHFAVLVCPSGFVWATLCTSLSTQVTITSA